MNGMSISKLAGKTGLTTATIRYYERAGLLSEPQRTFANHRRYRNAHLYELNAVMEARRAGFSVAEIRQMRRQARGKVLQPENVLRFVTRKVAQVDAKLARLQWQRDFLLSMRDQCGKQGCHWWQNSPDNQCTEHTVLTGSLTLE